MENCLELIKRVDEREVFLPGQRGSDSPHLFPEVRIHRSGGLIKKARLLFKQTQADGPSWSVFIGLGFLLASVMYHRIILRVSEPVVSTSEMIEFSGSFFKTTNPMTHSVIKIFYLNFSVGILFFAPAHHKTRKVSMWAR